MADGNGGEAMPAATPSADTNDAKLDAESELGDATMTLMENYSECIFLSEEMQAEMCSHLKQEGARHGRGPGVTRLPSSAQPHPTVTGGTESRGSSDGDDGVMIQADGWTPDFLSLSPEMRVAPSTATRATSAAVVMIDYLQCKACYHWTTPAESNCVACNESVDPQKALHLSKLVTDTQITESLRSLRAVLCDAFTKNRILDGGWELETKLKGDEENSDGRTSSSSSYSPTIVDTLTFVRKLAEFGVHVIKRHVRPLFAHPQLRRNGGIQAEAISGLLNAKPWWPNEESFAAAEGLDNEQVRNELEQLLGPKLSKAVSGEHSGEYQRDLLEQIKKDPGALDELKIFLDSIPAEEFERRGSGAAPAKGPRSRSRSPAIRSGSPALPPPRPHSSAEVSNDRAAPSPAGPKRTPSALGLTDKKLKPYVSSLETKAPVVSQKWPYGKLSKDILPKSNIEWKTWQDKKTGKVHEPIPVPLPELGNSRKRAKEFYSQMVEATKGERESMDNANEFWRKLPRPNMAVEYVRWQLLEQPIAGFSSPHMIEPKKNPNPWKQLKNVSQFKMGSRHADPNTESVEKLTPTTMLTDDLKVERNKSKLVLEGTECLKRARLHVIRGSYDTALEETESALSNFKSAGKYGQLYAKEIAKPKVRVVNMIKAEMDKLMKVSKEALERSQWDKAMSHIPRLRQACAWLDAQEVVYPEAREPTHWEIRKQISSENFPEGMEVIDDVKRDIDQRQQAAALQLDTASIASFFAAVSPVLDLADTVQLEEVESATNQRNRLPKTITADGSTFLMVVDLKSPDLPEKIKVGTPVFVRGERTLDSGKIPDAEDWLSGTVVSWNIRGDKYKVQYEDDDYEWIQTPTDLEVEINMFPEEVLIEADRFIVRSMTHQHPKLGKKVAVVAFTIVPPTPGYDLTLFGEIELKVTGVKSQKRLVEDGPRSRTVILPPKFLQPGSTYTVYDSITGKALDGEVDFIHADDQSKTTFAVGQPIELPKEGVYTVVARGDKEIGYPYTSEYSTCMWNASLQNLKEENQRGEVRVHLNKHIARSDELRVVVTWGAKPGALDSYTYTSEREKVEWRRTGKKVNGICLNIDTIGGYGPETITIRMKKGVGYSFSLKMTEGHGVSDLWTTSGAKVALFDHTGALAVYQVPPVRQGIKGMWWWHVFAVDAGLWEKPGHGILRVNQLSTHELAQLAVPGWTLMEAARKGQWSELSEHLNLYGQGKSSDQPALLPRQLVNAMTVDGETIMGLVCSHNAGSADDRGVGLDENGKSPLQKQVEALNLLMWWTVELEKRNRTTEAQNGGLPSEDALEKEWKTRGVRDCYIYRAVLFASVEVAVIVLEQIGVVARRSTAGSRIRSFFHKHGDDLLDLCVQKRPVSSLEKVLTALLGIEAVWERRVKRVFQEQDKVQIELNIGHGQWMDGVIVKRSYDTYKVQFAGGRREVSMSVSEEAGPGGQLELTGEAEVVASKPRPSIDVVPARLKWRTPALERARGLLHRTQQEIKSLEFGTHGNMHGNMQTGKARFLLNCDAVYKRVVTMLQEKSFE